MEEIKTIISKHKTYFEQLSSAPESVEAIAPLTSNEITTHTSNLVKAAFDAYNSTKETNDADKYRESLSDINSYNKKLQSFITATTADINTLVGA